ncbi:MAG: arylformamidase [Alphaproteobacteria bacterium]|jgi:arylformamidase|nr:arylformamidase [Alphaproteobacteria bacterium]
MHEDPSPQGKLTRRTMLAGAAAGTVALTTAPASAQRCPANPAHVKGPNVWLELDQKELDDAYDQSVYAYNQPNITDRRAANDETARPILGQPQRVAYGPSEIEKLDIYKTKRPNAPTLIFIHGGSWQNGSAERGFYIAEPYVKAGAHFIAVDFNNVREINGDLMPMVEQCRRAVGWVYRNAASFGGDPNQIYLCGHSSGGHLGGCVVITEWEKQGLPRDILKGALLGSGMYDLKAVRLSKRAAYVKFTDEMEQALSAQRHLDKIHTPLVLTHGTLETPEFQRQTRDFHAALKAAGKPVQLLVGKGYNHFETQETLGNPYGFMGRAALEMMKLTTAA